MAFPLLHNTTTGYLLSYPRQQAEVTAVLKYRYQIACHHFDQRDIVTPHYSTVNCPTKTFPITRLQYQKLFSKTATKEGNSHKIMKWSLKWLQKHCRRRVSSTIIWCSQYLQGREHCMERDLWKASSSKSLQMWVNDSSSGISFHSQ